MTVQRAPARSARIVTAGLAALTLIVGMAAPSGAYQRPGMTEVVTAVDSTADRNCEQNVSNPLGQSSLSRDARYIAFDSERCDLGPEDSNPYSDVFVRDRRVGRTKLASVSSLGIQAVNPPGLLAGSYRPSTSANGKYVAFDSDAINLVPGDTNMARDVFVHDRRTGATERVSVDSRGIQAGPALMLAHSNTASISADGRFVAFESYAPNLVLDDTNGAPDIFVHDRRAGTTERVSVASDGSQADEAPPLLTPDSFCASISGNGRYVAFRTDAWDLVENDTSYHPDVLVHDRKTGKTERVSVASDGTQAEGTFARYSCDHHAISHSGRFVVFASEAANLVPNDSARDPLDAAIPGDVFVNDRKTHRTERVSVTSAGEEVPEGSSHATISTDGRLVAFMSAANELDPRDTGSGQLGLGDFDGYIHNRRMASTEMISVSSRGKEAGSCGDLFATEYQESHPAAVSSDGSFVSFNSCSDNLTPDDGHKAMWDEFLRYRGPELGVGGLARSGDLRVSDSESFARSGSVAQLDLVTDVNEVLTDRGANLYGASLAYRPQFDDLFVRIQLEDMPYGHGTSLAGDPAILYGLHLTSNGTRYTVRVQRSASDSIEGLDPVQLAAGGASFGLFRCNDNTPLCTKVATLQGGYGTTGVEVVFALPLSAIGLEAGGDLSDLEAFTALGSYDLGAVKTLDTVALT